MVFPTTRRRVGGAEKSHESAAPVAGSITIEVSTTEGSTMSRGPLRAVLHHLHRLTGRADAGVADAQLLQRFAVGRDEAAFELLLWRHGPMVRGVCRRVLRHAEDAEDAFQATFLVLVRKAGSIGKRESLAGWLYRVAYRVALRARDAASRRPALLPLNGETPAPEVASDLVWRDLRPVLDEEVHRLPRKYSQPVILCYLQGKTYEQAARELGCPKGTLAIRLQRARELLRGRLSRRGVTLSAGAFAALLTEKAASAAVPVALVKATAHAAFRYAAGPAAATGAASAQVVSLTQGVLRSMFLTKLKAMAVVALLAAGLAGAGAGLSPRATPGTAMAADVELAAPVPENRPAVVNLPAQRDGVLLFIGTEIKEGEQLLPDDIVSVKIDGAVKKFRRLKEGDRVEDGQLLARLNDRLARDDVEVQKARLEAAEAELRAVKKTTEEAATRFERVSRLKQQNLVAEEEIRAAKLTWERYVEEENAKAALVKQARRQVQSAETVVEMHEIRAVRGTIKAILKQPREAVKSLETVFQIQTDGKPGKPPEKEKPAAREREGERRVVVGRELRADDKQPAEPLAGARLGDGNVYYSRARSFRIPFEVQEKGQRVSEVVLYVSTDQGKTYQMVESTPPGKLSFVFTAPQDGTYWFVVQVKDEKGNPEPSTDRLLHTPPGLKVCVDTKPPVVKLMPASLIRGKAKIEWEVMDENLDVSGLELAYCVNNDQRFLPRPPPRSARGEQTWDLPDKSRSVEVWMKARDKAGNETVSTITFVPGEAQSKDAEKARPHDNVRFVNSRKFELDCEINNVGKSKVKHVEIWVTNNGAETWKLLREVAPGSPYGVEVPGEGRYGFTLVAVSGAGAAAPRPRAGDEPQVWVEVDETRPELTNLAVGVGKEDGHDVLKIEWKGAEGPPHPVTHLSVAHFGATDKNLAPDPITISYAEKREGPWKPVAEKLPNTGRYAWRFPADLPAEIYVRVEAVDRAGNVGSLATPGPVLIDTQVPMIRLKGVKASGARN
jgi:RNA polymerase sigma factor (sigma-70 family)